MRHDGLWGSNAGANSGSRNKVESGSEVRASYYTVSTLTAYLTGPGLYRGVKQLSIVHFDTQHTKF